MPTAAATPVIVVHAGAGAAPPAPHLQPEARQALIAALQRGRDALAQGGAALDAVQAAVAFMEDEVPFFNAGRGAVLCADGAVELSAGVMRGEDRGAGAAALLTASRSPVAAARAVMEHSPHVLMAGPAADRLAAEHGVEQMPNDYFIIDAQRARLADRGSDFTEAADPADAEVDRDARGTVGAVCLDAAGRLAAATSTGGRRGQLPGRIGDTPTIGAGTWADAHAAVSCTGDGEAFVRAAAARTVAGRLAAGRTLEQAADGALADVRAAQGTGGLIAVAADGTATLRFTSATMNRGLWRGGEEPQAWV